MREREREAKSPQTCQLRWRKFSSWNINQIKLPRRNCTIKYNAARKRIDTTQRKMRCVTTDAAAGHADEAEKNNPRSDLTLACTAGGINSDVESKLYLRTTFQKHCLNVINRKQPRGWWNNFKPVVPFPSTFRVRINLWRKSKHTVITKLDAN